MRISKLRFNRWSSQSPKSAMNPLDLTPANHAPVTWTLSQLSVTSRTEHARSAWPARGFSPPCFVCPIIAFDDIRFIVLFSPESCLRSFPAFQSMRIKGTHNIRKLSVHNSAPRWFYFAIYWSLHLFCVCLYHWWQRNRLVPNRVGQNNDSLV